MGVFKNEHTNWQPRSDCLPVVRQHGGAGILWQVFALGGCNQSAQTMKDLGRNWAAWRQFECLKRPSDDAGRGSTARGPLLRRQPIGGFQWYADPQCRGPIADQFNFGIQQQLG